MFPSYNEAGKPTRLNGKVKLLGESLCPLGCLCCIMQQFYNKRCWCKEVKESASTQTDPVDLAKKPKSGTYQKETCTSSTQTDATNTFQQALQRKVTNDPLEAKHDILKARDFALNFMPSISPEKIFAMDKVDGGRDALSVSSLVDRHQYHIKKIKRQKEPGPEWKSYTCHGTVEHMTLQNAVNDTMDRYDLSGAKDPNFETAFEEVLDLFPVLKNNELSKHMVRSKLRHRISSRRHYTRIKSEASSFGMAVSALKRKRMEENALQQKILGDNIVQSSFNPTSPAAPMPLGLGVLSHSLSPVNFSTTPDTENTKTVPNILRNYSRRTPRKQSVTSCFKRKFVEREVYNVTDIEEEALDLSDPRQNVAIKIEPIEIDENM